MIEEIKNSEINTGLVDTADGAKNRFYDNSYPEWYKDLGVKNKEEFLEVIESKSGAKYEKIKALAEERLSNGYESKQFGQVMPDEDFRKYKGLDPAVSGSAISKTDAHRGLKTLSEDAPDSRFVDEKLVESQLNEVADDVLPNQTVDELNGLTAEELAILKEEADQMDLDLDDFPELKSADDAIKMVGEEEKMLRAMALCAVRKG
jgi:hypothetical protein